MRILRGISVAIIMFFIWIFFSTIAAFWFIGEYGLFLDFDPTKVPFWFAGPLYGSFIGIFVGPLYYWVIEPLRKSRES